jgi:hypothetical protein
MITKDNIKEVLSSITTSDIELAMEEKGDYVLVQLHIFNTGAYGSIHGMDYDEEISQIAADSGDLFIDKDEFLRLVEELDIKI